jgi:GxxExxY protein
LDKHRVLDNSLFHRAGCFLDLRMHIDELTGTIVKTCINIHTKIGPGCFEKVYEEILYYELIKQGLEVKRQLLLPIKYDDLLINNAYKLDLLVEDRLIVELKAVHPLPSVSFDQVRTHLVLLGLKHGLLLNFKVSLMKDGIHRVFNNAGNERLIRKEN